MLVYCVIWDLVGWPRQPGWAAAQYTEAIHEKPASTVTIGMTMGAQNDPVMLALLSSRRPWDQPAPPAAAPTSVIWIGSERK
jgi:hypothetical protein